MKEALKDLHVDANRLPCAHCTAGRRGCADLLVGCAADLGAGDVVAFGLTVREVGACAGGRCDLKLELMVRRRSGSECGWSTYVEVERDQEQG